MITKGGIWCTWVDGVVRECRESDSVSVFLYVLHGLGYMGLGFVALSCKSANSPSPRPPARPLTIGILCVAIKLDGWVCAWLQFAYNCMLAFLFLLRSFVWCGC